MTRRSSRQFLPQEHVPLAPLTTIGIGGRARWFIRAADSEDVAEAHRWCADQGIPLVVLGGGSNLVIADEDLDALVVCVAIAGIDARTDGADTLMRLGAGETWDRVVARAVSTGLAGLECLSGIPGNVGGTPIQNVGAYGQEVADSIVDVTAFDRGEGVLTELSASQCGFGYRTSRFKHQDVGRFVVCQVTLRLRSGQPTVTYPDIVRHLHQQGTPSPSLGDVREAVLAVRRGKGMVIDEMDPDTRSVGSFFTNPVVSADDRDRISSAEGVAVPGYDVAGGLVKIPAAWLIERSGFARGYQSGRVGLSSKHPLALINRGGATARDVLSLASQIKRRVETRFGIRLVPEPSFVGFGEDAEVAYLQETRG